MLPPGEKARAHTVLSVIGEGLPGEGQGGGRANSQVRFAFFLQGGKSFEKELQALVDGNKQKQRKPVVHVGNSSALGPSTRVQIRASHEG